MSWPEAIVASVGIISVVSLFIVMFIVFARQ